MAGAGYKLFNTGDVLTAAQVNTYLQEQAVMRFANATARTTALSGVLAEGMVSYLDDTNTLEVYNGSAWVGATGDITEIQAGTGISVASGTGPIPTVTNTVATAFDAKGDLVIGTGADTFARLAVGANDLLLTAASGETTGVKWGGAWTSYTPTFTNLTTGNGTTAFAYLQIGKLVHVAGSFTFGSTSSITSSFILFSLPVTAAEGNFAVPIGGAVLRDAGTAFYFGSVIGNSTTAAEISTSDVSGTYPKYIGVSSTIPFTWTTTDYFQVTFTYRAA